MTSEEVKQLTDEFEDELRTHGVRLLAVITDDNDLNRIGWGDDVTEPEALKALCQMAGVLQQRLFSGALDIITKSAQCIKALEQRLAELEARTTTQPEGSER